MATSMWKKIQTILSPTFPYFQQEQVRQLFRKIQKKKNLVDTLRKVSLAYMHVFFVSFENFVKNTV